MTHLRDIRICAVHRKTSVSMHALIDVDVVFLNPSCPVLKTDE